MQLHNKNNMRGGNPAFLEFKKKAEEAHAQIKEAVPEADKHAKTAAAVNEVVNGTNNMMNTVQRLHEDISQSTTSNEAKDHSRQMMNAAQQAQQHVTSGNFMNALKSATEAKNSMNNAVDSVQAHAIGQKPLSEAKVGDHFSALKEKVTNSVNSVSLFSGGANTRKVKKSKDPNYRQRKHQVLSSTYKYSNYFNRLKKPKKSKKRRKSKK